MVAKKSLKKTSSRRAKKRQAKVTSTVREKFISRKIKIALTSLVFFLIVFAGSWIGYEYLFFDGTLLGDLFFILAYLSGFLSLAFFIALLVFLVLKAFRKY